MNKMEKLFANLKTKATLDVDTLYFTLTIKGEGIYTHFQVIGEDIFGNGDWWDSVKIGNTLLDINVWVDDIDIDASKNKVYITFYPFNKTKRGTDTSTYVKFPVKVTGNRSVYND